MASQRVFEENHELLAGDLRVNVRHRRLLAALACCGLLSGCAGGGGSSQDAASGSEAASIDAYCAYVYGKGSEFRKRYRTGPIETADEGVLRIFQVIAAPRDLSSFFAGLAEVSPSEVQPDVEAIRDSFDQLAKNTGKAITDPIGALAENLGNGLSNAGAAQRFNDYTMEKCGPPPTAGTKTDVPATAEAFPSVWPPDDQTTAIGLRCRQSGLESLTVELWAFGEDQAPKQFYSLDLVAALKRSDALGPDGKYGLSIGKSFCNRRASWSSDYRRVAFDFRRPERESEYHIAVLDLPTMTVKDLTQPRQRGSGFGTKLLDEQDPTFEVGSAPNGNATINQDVVIFGLEMSYGSDADGTVMQYGRVQVDNPTQVTPIARDDVHYDQFDAVDFEGDCYVSSCLGGVESPDGRWTATSPDDYESDAEVLIAPTTDLGKTQPVSCATGVVLGWADRDSLVIWDGSANLVVATIASNGAATCGPTLLPQNDYQIDYPILLSPDGRYVYLGSVDGAEANSYRISVEGGEPEPAAYPTAPDDVTFFRPGPLD